VCRRPFNLNEGEHKSTYPKLKEGKGMEIILEFLSVFLVFEVFGKVFAKRGKFLTFLGSY
jgi:hypothetical protein